MRTQWHRWTSGLLVAASALCWAPASRADDAKDAKAPVKIAVRSFSAKGVDPSTASTLETVFCDALAKESLDVLCSEDLNALLGEKQRELGLGSCENEEECLQSISKASLANRVVTGEVSKLGDSFMINVTLIDIASGKVLARANDKTTKIEGLVDKLPGLAKKLAAAK